MIVNVSSDDGGKDDLSPRELKKAINIVPNPKKSILECKIAERRKIVSKIINRINYNPKNKRGDNFGKSFFEKLPRAEIFCIVEYQHTT